MQKSTVNGETLLSPRPEDIAQFSEDMGPVLVTVVDTEEDFDWRAPFSRNNTSVQSATQLSLAQRIFEKFHIHPTYALDYPIASQETGFRELSEWADDGLCEIAAQCHPWVNPPYDETLSLRNSYPGNLAEAIEYRKLEILTETITEKTGRRPSIYKAGRYGIGEHSADILSSLGYTIDMSVYAHRDFRSEFGPDFRKIGPMPYWFQGGDTKLLEIPLTAGFFGVLRWGGRDVYSAINSPWLRKFKLTGIAARLGLLNRATLTPEGIPLDEAQRLTRALLSDGQKVFTLAFHSPSLVPGNTPYVESVDDLERLLGWLEDYFSFFLGELGGSTVTPHEVLAFAKGGMDA